MDNILDGRKVSEELDKEYIKKMNTPIVIKADGLASGKGVFICNNKNEALQKCKEINQGNQAAGKYTIDLNSTDFAEGIYFYTFTIGEKQITKRMVVSK